MEDSTATTANPMLIDTDPLHDVAEGGLPLMQATAADGRHLLLVVSRETSAGCVVYRDGEPIFTAPADEPGIDAAVDHLLTVADGERTLSR